VDPVLEARSARRPSIARFAAAGSVVRSRAATAVAAIVDFVCEPVLMGRADETTRVRPAPRVTLDWQAVPYTCRGERDPKMDKRKKRKNGASDFKWSWQDHILESTTASPKTASSATPSNQAGGDGRRHGTQRKSADQPH